MEAHVLKAQLDSRGSRTETSDRELEWHCKWPSLNLGLNIITNLQ